MTSIILPLLAAATAAISGYHYTGDEYVEAPDARYRPAVIEVDSEQYLDSLVKNGTKVLRRRGDLALAYIPIDTVAATSHKRGNAGTPYAATPRRRIIRPALDEAMEWYDAWKVYCGEDLPQGYDGSGVVVGICDIGIDPLHPTFLDSDGKSRIRKIVQYKESQGERIELEGDDAYSEWKTDTIAEWHATHVAGILAGNGADSPYRGAAPGADIVVTTSQLSDVGLLAGVEDIIEYAESVGKPAVVNLSMGSYNGPHDGTSLFSRYMDMLGEEAVICMSAGNEGDRSNTLHYSFTEDVNEVKVRIGNRGYNNFDAYGMTDLWLDDSSRMTVTLGIYDSNSQFGKIIYELPRFECGNDSDFMVSSDTDSEFAKYFTGNVTIRGGVWKGNGRRYVQVEYDVVTEAVCDQGAWGRYNLALSVSATAGRKLDVYADGTYSCLRTFPGQPAPGSDGSFSDLATGHNLVSVGMYNSSHKAEKGTVNVNSGYATLIDGRVEPVTVAPGSSMYSAFSRYADPAPADDIDGLWTHNTGTSMSSPYAAGFVATWLQANPKLKIDDVKDIISSTNRHDYPDEDNPRHGQGWFDPYSGLLMAIEKAGVKDIDGDGSAIRFLLKGRNLTVVNPGNIEVSVSVFDMQGRRMMMQDVGSGVSEIKLDLLPKGIYVVTGEGMTSGDSPLKIILR